MQTLWNIVLKERVDGYEHRAPKRRTKQEVGSNLPPTSACNMDDLSGISKCLIPSVDLIIDETHDYHNN